MFEPGIFKAENGGMGDVGVESEEERDVVGRGANSGGESAVREKAAEFSVQEGTIETGESWGAPLVSPSIESIKKGELKERKGIDAGVEGVGQGKAKEGVVLFRGGPHEVVVPDQEPGARDVGREFV